MSFNFWKKKEPSQLSQMKTFVSDYEKTHKTKELLKLKKQVAHNENDEAKLSKLESKLYEYKGKLDTDEILEMFYKVDINTSTVHALKKLHEQFAEIIYIHILYKLHSTNNQVCPDVVKLVTAYFFHRLCVEGYTAFMDSAFELDWEQLQTYLDGNQLETELIRHCNPGKSQEGFTDRQLLYIRLWASKLDDMTDSCAFCCGF